MIVMARQWNAWRENRMKNKVQEMIRGGFLKMNILVMLHAEGCEPHFEKNGDWIDLLTAQEYTLKKGDFALIDLGVSIRLPDHMEAHLAPRSSTFKKYGVIQTNGVGVIDNSYCGEDDIWKMPVYATRDVVIPKGVRIAQFRIFAVQPSITCEFVHKLVDKSRGGFGSTGD